MFSDLHVDVNGGLAVELDLDDCDAIVVAGDVCERMATRGIEWLEKNLVPAGKPVIYVPGNHCFYHRRFPAELEAAKPAFEDAGVTLLARGETTLVGDVVVCGATLWTDFKISGDQRQAILAAADRHRGMNDFRLIRFADGSRPFLPSNAIAEHEHAVASITKACKNALAAADSFANPVEPEKTLARNPAQPIADAFSNGGGGANSLACKSDYGPAKVITDRRSTAGSIMIVTHHAPSVRSLRTGAVREPLDAAYASDLEALILDLRPDVWVHGHIHSGVDYLIGDTRVVSNPLGYRLQHGRGKQAVMRHENERFDPSFTVEIGQPTPPDDEAAIAGLWS